MFSAHKSHRKDAKGPTGEVSEKKRLRKNDTTPPKINPLPKIPTTPTSIKTTSQPEPSLWVRSPEDRKQFVTNIVTEATNDLRTEMEEMHTEIKTMISELPNDIQKLVEQKMATEKAKFDGQLRTMQTEMVQVKQELQSTKAENLKIKKELVKQEESSKRSNLKLYGLFEDEKESKFNCKQKVMSMLRDTHIDLHPCAIASAHRIGFKSRYKARPVVVSFQHQEDRDLVLARSNIIYSRWKIKAEEDYPHDVEMERKELRPIMLAANRILDANGNHKYRSSLNSNKLLVNNKTYTTQSVEQLPYELNPKIVATPSKQGITAFFTKASPLSNHHPSEMTIRKKKYTSNEQFYMEQKALTFGDLETAKQIMASNDPAHQKALGRDRNIKDFKPFCWDELKLEIMRTGLEAKFGQNRDLQNFLLQTGSNVLIEANPGDKYWGAGMSSSNPRIWKKNSLSGFAHNHLGNILMDLRRELKRNT